MADEEQLRILQEGVEAWNRWRGEHPDVRPDLGGADLRRVNLSEAFFSAVPRDYGLQLDMVAHLHEADLRGAFLPRANLRRALLFEANLGGAALVEADLSGADLNGTNLSEANLEAANLSGADLSHSNLSKADLRGASFWQTGLGGADLSNTRVGWTLFGSVDLSKVKGLESVRHEGPSTIGIDTIYRSQGRIPEAFLRGVGVPEEIIVYMRSPLGRAIEYYSCFISYSSKDQAFAERLHADLQAKGVRCWFAPEDMKIGDKIRDRLDQSIRLLDKLLVILSEHSIGSDWVEDEAETAFEEERKRGQTVLFPVRLDDTVMETGEAWAAKVRQRHIGDFRMGKEQNAYRGAFERLVRDLKAGTADGNG